MALFRSMGARKDAARGTSPLEVRKGLANLFTGPGVLPGATSPLVVGTGSWAYQVRVAGFVTTRGAADGTHFFGNDGATSVATTVKPGAGLSRIDVIWVRHPSATENGESTSEPEFGVTQGTPASVPIAPTIPIGALELARNTMTSAATSTASAGNTITQTAARAGLRGAQFQLASAVLPSPSGAIGGAELAFINTPSIASPTGRIRATVKLLLQGTVAGDTFLVRVRSGSASGPELATGFAYLGNPARTTLAFTDLATVTAATAQPYYVTMIRYAGSGTVQALAGSTVIIDESPV